MKAKRKFGKGANSPTTKPAPAPTTKPVDLKKEAMDTNSTLPDGQTAPGDGSPNIRGGIHNDPSGALSKALYGDSISE